MKTKVLFAVLMMFAATALSQNKTVFAPDHIGEVKVTPPEFVGLKVINTANEMSLINTYLMENVGSFENVTNYRPQGTEVVQFTVTSKGKVRDFKIINSVSRDVDAEMISVLQTTDGMWKPGYNNNEPIAMTKEISMMFYPDDFSNKPVSEIFKEKATDSFISANKALFEKRNIKKALRLYSASVNYVPYDKSCLLMRGLCRYELGDKEGAKQDWIRMAALGDAINMSEFIAQIEGMKGFDEMMATIRK
jgi:hypothetical protein